MGAASIIQSLSAQYTKNLYRILSWFSSQIFQKEKLYSR